MKTMRFASLAAVLTAAVVTVGCSDNGVNPKAQLSTDQSAITGTLAAEPAFLDDGYIDGGETTNLAPAIRAGQPSPGVADGVTTAIEPFSFWRTITHRTTSFEFAFADTDSTGLPRTANVTVRRRFVGTFNVLPRDPNHPDLADRANVVHKPLLDHWVRHFLLKRIDLPGATRPLWRMAGTSAVEVTSEPSTTLINSIRVQTSSLDTTLTDPSAIVPLRRVLRFGTEDSVTVTVTTPRTDDVVILYLHDRRARFANNGDGTYTRKFGAEVFTGWRHFGVNALAHGTLFDDQAPYDSKAWIVPYVVVGGPVVDYLP
jgi:hypothetical protein